MLTFIVSDNQETATRIRIILSSQDIDCPLTHIVSIDRAAEFVTTGSRDADLVFVVLTPDAERALTSLKELRKSTSATLVAIGSAQDPQQILRVIHSGPDDYLDEEGDLAGEIQALLKRLRSRTHHQTTQGQVITVLSPSGGSGCSMLAANLAAALAKQHGSAGLCDLDLRRGDLASLLNLKPRYTLIDLCRNLQKLDQELFDQSMLVHESGIHLLAAPQSFADVQQVTSDAAETIIRLAAGTFPFVVVDLEDFFHREQFRVMQLSDTILFVLRLDFSALRNARRTLDYLDSVGVDREKLQLVVNQYGRPKELSPSQAEEALGMEISYFVPDEPRTAVSSFNQGNPVVLETPRRKIAKAVTQMAARVSEGVLVCQESGVRNQGSVEGIPNPES